MEEVKSSLINELTLTAVKLLFGTRGHFAGLDLLSQNPRRVPVTPSLALIEQLLQSGVSTLQIPPSVTSALALSLSLSFLQIVRDTLTPASLT